MIEPPAGPSADQPPAPIPSDTWVRPPGDQEAAGAASMTIGALLGFSFLFLPLLTVLAGMAILSFTSMDPADAVNGVIVVALLLSAGVAGLFAAEDPRAAISFAAPATVILLGLEFVTSRITDAEQPPFRADLRPLALIYGGLGAGYLLGRGFRVLRRPHQGRGRG